MTSRIVVNNIEADAGVSTVTFGSNISGNFVGSISVSGVTTVAAGSTSAPSISPTGDSNTGIFFPSADTIAFAEGGVEALRLDSSGNVNIDSGTVYVDAANNSVGINTTTQSSNCALMVVGNHVAGHSALKIQRTDNNISSLAFYSQSASRDAIIYSTNGAALGIEATNSIIMAPNTGITAGTFGSTGLSFPSGKGIDFSANTNAAGMTSELLDDYEEGTFTVTMQYFSGGGYQNATFTNTPQTTGYYVKVGKICTAYYYSTDFQINTGNALPARFEGLPFTAANLTEGYCAGSITHVTCFAQTAQNLYITPNSTAVVPIQQGTTSSSTWNNSSNVYIMWSITYRTN